MSAGWSPGMSATGVPGSVTGVTLTLIARVQLAEPISIAGVQANVAPGIALAESPGIALAESPGMALAESAATREVPAAAGAPVRAKTPLPPPEQPAARTSARTSNGRVTVRNPVPQPTGVSIVSPNKRAWSRV